MVSSVNADAQLAASTMALKKSMDVEKTAMSNILNGIVGANMQTPASNAPLAVTNPTQFVQNEAAKAGRLDIYA
ncbi:MULTISPECIES: hypothetical protein [Campylobacter]|uniref:Motility protein n=1 Tax=Campylobacter porcelli TaxID=1660073 RepID=A0A1X9SXJ2_9BACT|nr:MULTISPECIES: hypothetical protein [unclassified Campylobacter]ARR00987.1 hypothetical protein CSUIS_1187 [Campylobacter sp. RM6137]MCR8678973.1 hypothetical protein [Campylobacter sp. RM19072]MCR8696108.1 hypothetical protein [Campylobacter sp. RM19073]MEE3744471.1 hypothetical protein [Campylobacter sp. CX2-4855-23]